MYVTILSSALAFVLIFGNLASAQSKPQILKEKPSMVNTESIKSSSLRLQSEWEKEKKLYKDKFESQIKAVEKQIGVLQKSLDNGDPKRRDQINEAVADLKRIRENIKNIFHEITAASTINWGNVQGDIKHAIEDFQD